MSSELIVDAKNAVGESPVWVPEHNALFWADIPVGKLWRWNAADGSTDAWQLPEMVGCIAHVAGDHWMAATETGVFSVKLLDKLGIELNIFKRFNFMQQPRPAHVQPSEGTTQILHQYI